MCEKICEKYMLKSDMAIIERWAKDKNLKVSFRPAGKDTLKCLARGAGAKPHEIPDKTLKKKYGSGKSVSDHNQAVEAFFKEFPESGKEKAINLLMGLAGHWNKNHVDGIYLTSLGYKVFGDEAIWDKIFEEEVFGDMKAFERRNNKYDIPYLVLDNNLQKRALIKYYDQLVEEDTNKALYLFTRLFFSGDYDMHDMLQTRSAVSTEVDLKLLASLQEALKAGRKSQLIDRFHLDEQCFEQEEADDDYRRVQHGPQYNYTAQMLNENIRCSDIKNFNVLMDSVVNMDPPVVLYDSKADAWKVLPDVEAVKGLYKGNGRTVKVTWTDQDERDGNVKWMMKQAIRICFNQPKSIMDVNLDQLLEKVPGFMEIYGNAWRTYAEAALKEMFAS